LILGVSVLALVAATSAAFATPSSEFWTPCVIDIQPARVTHLGIDNYYRVGSGEAFPTDIGPEWGANINSKIGVEYGVDLLTNQKNPLLFNAKIGYHEGALFKNAPALQIGLFDFGTETTETASRVKTDYNIVYLVTGKTLPDGKTRIHAAGYYGNPGALVNGDGKTENTGWMLAFDRQLCKSGKWVLAGDYASGKNYIGGGGAGVYYYFTKDISLLTGPVWFNDKTINGDMKWTTQLDINF
jgi:hypothetical protein